MNEQSGCVVTGDAFWQAALNLTRRPLQASNALLPTHCSPAQAEAVDGLNFDEHNVRLVVMSYLQDIQLLSSAYPALATFTRNFRNLASDAKQLVREAHLTRYGRPPGRCALLIFHETRVEERHFASPQEFSSYLNSSEHKDGPEQHRLWILEDLDPEWVEVLGGSLGLDPLVLAEQTNTFNFTASDTIQTRAIPSMIKPASAFTLRYYEFRQLGEHDAIESLTNQKTFAANSRRIERWRDVDTITFKNKWKHSFVRRCASFWSNQKEGQKGWDAVILVDPPYNNFEWSDGISGKSTSCSILADLTKHSQLSSLWAAREHGSACEVKDSSYPYHGGATTLSEYTLSLHDAEMRGFLSESRNKGSLLDEIVLHWTRLADNELIHSARAHSANSAHYLLKALGVYWGHQLDLVQAAAAQSEYFKDDFQAGGTLPSSTREWRTKLSDLGKVMDCMHPFRVQMYHFEGQMALNLERLGMCHSGMTSTSFHGSDEPILPKSIRAAQRDFAHLHGRLKPYVERAVNLIRIANELASLHASLKSVQDSELGLALSILASIVFPATLVASIFSMGGDFLPGQSMFWVFWATTLPLTSILAAILVFGRDLQSILAPYFKPLRDAFTRTRLRTTQN